MKTIGLLGGMSWESTLSYYRLVNQATQARLGGLHSAKLVLHSVDFHEIEALQVAGDWARAGAILGLAARSLELAGADFIVLCTNTMHKVAEDIEAAVQIPLLHIADATGEVIRAASLKKIALLGTRFTMEQDFYRGRLQDKFGFEVIVPEAEARERVHRVIYQELCQGKILAASKRDYRNIIAELVAQGAEGIVFGCTEIAMLVGPEDSPVPVFDTAAIHAECAVAWALG